MQMRESRSLASQVVYSYGANLRAKHPFKLYFTGLKEKSIMLELLQKNNGFENWFVEKSEKSYHEIFDNNKIVYLSSDSDNVLETLDPSTVYIVGGIVDRNRHKGLCQRLATEKEIKTAKLPISSFLEGHTRKVITVNQVVQILLKYKEYNDWGKAMLEVMPARKGYKIKKSSEDAEQDQTGK
mmetsp:Transcript_13071/g.32024  ORF Transcript_13071/g.32024 Transcript_13071/m.32024 type:complete len:183 (+) Transcript_13071:419-967(+)